ncbi:integrase, catalytic region, zinc finger, CCHC-type containing protein [Tanacetum coccineum]
MDEINKFAAKEGESLESVYEILTTLVNIMDHNNVRPILVSINTKFLNCLQPEWSKYVTMVRHNQIGDIVSYDQLYDSLVQFEPHVQASKVKRAIRNHDPLALIAHSNASSSHSHANPSSSHSPQPYYVTHPSSVDGRVDIQTKNAGYGGNGNRNAGRQNKNQAFNAENGNVESNQIFQRVPLTESNSGKANVQCYNCNEKGHYARDCPKPRFHDAKYFREQMLLAMKDEAGSNLNDEENDFMLDNSFRYEALEELTAAVIMMARIQPTADNGVQKRNYDAKAVSEVNASYKMIPKWVHEHKNQGKRKTVINTSNDNQIDSNILFDDPYVENNGGSDEHDSTAHDQYHVLAIKAFKEREDRYLEDIVDLEEKMSSHDRIVYKIGVGSSNSVRRPKSKDTKSKNIVLKNANAKSSSAYVQKTPSSVRIDYNKLEPKNSNEFQSNASVLNTKTVTAVNDGSNLVCVSYGKNVFLLSHEKCVVRYALSIDSRIVDSGCSKHMTGILQLLRNFIEKFMGTVRFGNDHFAAITGYGDYVQDNLMICHVYYVEGLGHNLFLVGKFCDGYLEVAFRSNTCYVQNLERDDLLTGSRKSNLYTISISEMAVSSPMCLMSKATSTKSWLWHCIL